MFRVSCFVFRVSCLVLTDSRWREVDSGEVPRGQKMLYPGTDPESYITEYTLVYEDKRFLARVKSALIYSSSLLLSRLELSDRNVYEP